MQLKMTRHCLCLSLSVLLSIYHVPHLSIYLSLYLSCLSVCLSACLYIYLSVHLSVRLSIYDYDHLFIYLH